MLFRSARAAARGVRSMVGFTYRRVPAIALARQLVAGGRLGEIRHVRAQYLQDWIADPAAPMSWRLEKDKAGSGAPGDIRAPIVDLTQYITGPSITGVGGVVETLLKQRPPGPAGGAAARGRGGRGRPAAGDIGAHIVDLTQYITGQSITGVGGMLETFVKQRPLAAAGGALSGVGGEGVGQVTVDDAAVFLARFSGGALAAFEATRFALGRKNGIRIEVNGSEGSLAFDFEDMNVLEFFDGSEPAERAGFRRIIVTEPEHPYVAAWWPAGHGLGYEHGFTHQVVDLVTAIAEGTDPAPSFADGLQVQIGRASCRERV